jgi:predicted nucleic acid-binding protein
VAVLVDSNVLIFSIQQGHPWHEESINALEFFLAADETVCVFLQNIAEFWNVCTRPADKNGLGLRAEETERRLSGLDPILTLLHETPAVYPEWRKLLVQHEVKGIQVHDARLVAGMTIHGINRILTYNPADFKRYSGIRALHPRQAQQAAE